MLYEADKYQQPYPIITPDVLVSQDTINTWEDSLIKTREQIDAWNETIRKDINKGYIYHLGVDPYSDNHKAIIMKSVNRQVMEIKGDIYGMPHSNFDEDKVTAINRSIHNNVTVSPSVIEFYSNHQTNNVTPDVVIDNKLNRYIRLVRTLRKLFKL